jgi:hypothetical protein
MCTEPPSQVAAAQSAGGGSGRGRRSRHRGGRCSEWRTSRTRRFQDGGQYSGWSRRRADSENQGGVERAVVWSAQPRLGPDCFRVAPKLEYRASISGLPAVVA